MSGVVVLPDLLMKRMEQLKTDPEETTAEVISWLLDYYDEGIDEDLERKILKGLDDTAAGRHRPLSDIANEMGI